MRTGNMETWIAELRSTDKRQGDGYLRREDRYCCLGVGCELIGLPSEALTRSGVPDIHTYEGMSGLAPAAFLNWLYETDVFFEGAGDVYLDADGVDVGSVSELNDSGFTFAQIADLLDYFGLGLVLEELSA